MAVFVASTAVTQASDCINYTITDISNYSAENKATFSARQLFIYNSEGQTFDKYGNLTDTPTYIDFNFADYPSDTITIPLPPNDNYALTIIMNLVSTNPQTGSIYTYSIAVLLVCYIKQFKYGIGQIVAANQSLLKDTNLYESWSNLQTEIDNAEDAIAFADVNMAQQALERANQLRLNELKAF